VKNYNKYLLENIFWKGSKELTEKEFWKIFNKNCKNFDPNILITKKFDDPIKKINYIFIEYIKNRRSVEEKNYYTLMLNNFESWENFPKRQQICELNGFWISKRNSHIVIPFDNSKWGVTTDTDIWYCNFFDGSLKIINRILNTHNISDENWEKFIEDLILLGSEYSDKVFSSISKYLFSSNVSTEQLKNRYVTVYHFFKDELTPKNLKFKLTEYNKLKDINEQLEIWTDSPCLYVNTDTYYNEILPKIKSQHEKLQ